MGAAHLQKSALVGGSSLTEGCASVGKRKRKRGEELSYSLARHSLWEQGELGATNLVLLQWLSGGNGGGNEGQE